MDSTIYHIVPTNDLKPHSDHRACKCQPTPSEDGLLIIHNSFDGREFFEPDNKNVLKEAHRRGVMGNNAV